MRKEDSQKGGKKPQVADKKPSAASLSFNIGAVILMFIALFMLVIVCLKSYTRHGNEIDVPNLKGMTISQAIDKLEDAGLDAEINDSVYIKNITPNTIYAQSLAPGTHVKIGRVIYLTVNTSQPPMVTMPDIADNCSVREAIVKLTTLGISIAPVERIKGEKDWVYAVKINGKNVVAGERVPSSARITLVVGDGNFYDQDIDGDEIDSEEPIEEIGEEEEIDESNSAKETI